MNGDAFLFGSSGFAAVAGYPLVSVTGGYSFGLPIGITFMASAWSEPTLIKLASGFEAAAGVRRRPRFRPTLDSRRQHLERAEYEDCGRGNGCTAATCKSCARPADDAPPVAACGPVGQADLVSPRAIIPGRPFAGPVFLLFNKNNGLDSN